MALPTEGRRPSDRAINAVLLAIGLCASFLFTLVVPIQAKLPFLLSAAREDTAWVITATLVVSAITTPIAGTLGDRYGKRRVIVYLLAITLIGSVTVALSPQIIGVIIGRVLQGAMAGVIPLGIAVMRDTLPIERVDGGIAMMSSTLGVGSAVGLPISAIVAQYSDWRLLFWFTGALCAFSIGLVIWIIPAGVARATGRFDYVGAVGLSAALIAVLLAITKGDQWGWDSPQTVLSGFGGGGLLVLWGWYQIRSAQPLLDLRLAARRPVLLTNLASVAMGFALFTSSIVYPQLLEMPASSAPGFGLSLVGASLIVMPSGLMMVLVAPWAGRIVRILGPKVLLVAGAVALGLAYAFTIFLHTEIWHILVANIFIGIGVGLGYASMPMLIMRAVPQGATAASNGLNALSRSLGLTAAAAVMGAILTASSAQSNTGQPTVAGFQYTFMLGLLASASALLLALMIPRGAPRGDSRPTPR